MRMALSRLLAMTLVAGLTAATACQQRTEIDEEGVDTLEMEDTTVLPPAAPDTGIGDTAMGAMEGAEVAVTNPMPHAMIVRADWGQGAEELGEVAPNETKTFEIGAAPGTEVTLTATDAAETHSPSGTVTVSADSPASWTIQ